MSRAIYLVLLTHLISFSAIAQSYTDLNVEQAYTKWINGIFLLDVRTVTEFQAEHIAGAINIPVDELENRLSELDGQQHSEILVYCKAGGRSARAAQLLVEHGFEQVYNMVGGIQAWVAAGYPTVSGEGSYYVISLEEAYAMYQNGVFVLDARSPFGYIAGHIPGAVNIPTYELQRRINELAHLKEKPILVYCADTSCSSSERAAEILIQNGFTQVYIFRGGFESWKNAGYPVESASIFLLCNPQSDQSKKSGDIFLLLAIALLIIRRNKSTP